MGPIKCLRDFINPEADIKVKHCLYNTTCRVPTEEWSAVIRFSLCMNHPSQFINSILTVYFYRVDLLWENLCWRSIIVLTVVQMYIFIWDCGEVADHHQSLGMQAILWHYVKPNRIYLNNRQRATVELSRRVAEAIFLYPLVPTKLNSLSPPGAICVTVPHELPLPLLTSGLWVRHNSRATAQARITPKTSAAPSCLRERDSDRCCSSAL